MAEKVVLAYSGGLDTSVAIRWLKEKYGFQVVTLTVDLGGKDVAGVQEKALKVGAVKAEVEDVGELFVRSYIFPALKAGAVYQGQYPLATALGRPLIASLLAEVALEEGATTVAHGCTGKGNDQVRFEVSLAALAPHLRVVAPAREWGMTREETIQYARERDILSSMPGSGTSPYPPPSPAPTPPTRTCGGAALSAVPWRTRGPSHLRTPSPGPTPSLPPPTSRPMWKSALSRGCRCFSMAGSGMAPAL